MTTVHPPDPSLSYGTAPTPKGTKRPRPDDDDLVDARLLTKAVEVEVDSLKSDVGNIKSDVNTLKTDIGSIKSDVDTLRTDVGNIKSDVDTLKTDIGNIKRDVGDLSKKVDDSSRCLENLTTKVDGLSRKLTVVARGHVAHVKNSNRFSPVTHLMEVPFADDTLPWGQRVPVPGCRNDTHVYLPLLDSAAAFSQLSLRHAKAYYAGYYPEDEVARQDLATLKDAIWKAIGRNDKLPV